MTTGRLRINAWGWLLGLSLALMVAGRAERLPIKTYTTADGLTHDQIHGIVRDSHGFLWFCTTEGLSRFDGYQFTNYTTNEGLPSPTINDLLATRSGEYWVATGGGLCRFNLTASPTQPTGGQWVANHRKVSEPRFTVYQPNNKKAWSITVLVEDHAGAIWCGTGGGLYKMEREGGLWRLQFVDLGMPSERYSDTIVYAMIEDRRRALWIGAGSGLYRRQPDGRIERYTTRQGLPFDEVRSLLEDRSGQLWVGTRAGLCRMVHDPNLDQWVVANVYTTKDGLANNDITSLFESSKGKLWIGVSGGLSAFLPSPKDTQKFRSYTTAHGLSGIEISALAEDRDGNLWMGSEGGAMKMARNGFITYDEDDGLGSTRIKSIFESQAGELCATSLSMSALFINRFDGQRFTAIRPHLPKHIIYFGQGWLQTAFQDHTGEWWVPTDQGLCRFPKVRRVDQLAYTPPKAVYTNRDGLIVNNVFRLFEDSRGDIWIGTYSETKSGLMRWRRATETLTVDNHTSIVPTAFCEDAPSHLWIGTNVGLVRYVGGKFTVLTTEDGLPANWIGALYLDRKGRLWIATSLGGLGRMDHPKADPPQIVSYTTAQGLSSNGVWGITGDRWGRIYIGTGRGVDRLDPESGHIKHYTTADGLAGGLPIVAFHDRQGALWFGMSKGLSRLLPELDPPELPPSIRISALRIAGEPYPISDLGDTHLSGLALTARQNHLQIEFVGLSFGAGERLRYQYQLEGADKDWSAPTDQRAVHYPNLAPGTYHFRVRAMNVEGVYSPTPAAIDFTIDPPLWRRGWFLTLAALALAAAVYAVYRYQLAQAIRLERVRTRIATDLHDDIGASLSGMALMSDVLKRQLGESQGSAAASVTALGDSARRLVEAMSDIVWSIDPRRDDLQNLVTRIRQLATQMLDGAAGTWRLEAPPHLDAVKLTPEQRRHVYLIVKEALHNIVRHAGASAVVLSLRIEHRRLIIEVNDNGRGFTPSPTDPPPAAARGGNGLPNLRARAAELGGRLAIESAPGAGTRLTLSVPLM